MTNRDGDFAGPGSGVGRRSAPIPAERPVLLLRHGESVANRERLIVSRLENGEAAYGLTARGREQVTAAVTEAAETGMLDSTTRVVSSPFLRTIETARTAEKVLGVPFEVESRLAERDFGTLELTGSDRYGRVWARDRIDPTHGDWGVEPIADVLARALRALASLARSSEAGCLLLCTHGDVASALLCHAAGEGLARHREVGVVEPGRLVPLVRAPGGT